jgi:hypothetical protein
MQQAALHAIRPAGHDAPLDLAVDARALRAPAGRPGPEVELVADNDAAVEDRHDPLVVLGGVVAALRDALNCATTPGKVSSRKRVSTPLPVLESPRTK